MKITELKEFKKELKKELKIAKELIEKNYIVFNGKWNKNNNYEIQIRNGILKGYVQYDHSRMCAEFIVYSNKKIGGMILTEKQEEKLLKKCNKLIKKYNLKEYMEEN